MGQVLPNSSKRFLKIKIPKQKDIYCTNLVIIKDRKAEFRKLHFKESSRYQSVNVREFEFQAFLCLESNLIVVFITFLQLIRNKVECFYILIVCKARCARGILNIWNSIRPNKQMIFPLPKLPFLIKELDDCRSKRFIDVIFFGSRPVCKHKYHIEIAILESAERS